ncbi:hypothetical protein [Halodesulfovibrio marinisediminis]|uniref:Phage Mu protein F like protein n=1 Tax=Halodesulfovibrio marinisediminis DSM 17456 TaxID=1121457 RepID=A0A1N6DGB1_9BACT|nr:hypothetical protein [Halodesulfovibrio marinisediminis]SIN69723.1 hypothetical protein SAMN02745161_0109 [Halodesulfovibrio marinisediminis DSM 17456]
MQTDDTTLSNLHPLFTRLSGQVIWLLMEENEASPEDLNAFMDNVMAWRSNHLQTMRNLIEDKKLYMQITVDRIEDIPEDQEACTTCESLCGKIIPASHPDLIAMLPPYSLGCRCRGEIITESELPESPDFLTPEDCPKHSFMCSSGWFLNYPWAKTLNKD